MTPTQPAAQPQSRRRAQPIGALIPGLLREYEQRQKPLFLVQRQWGRLVGRALAKHSKPASLRRGRLIIQVESPGDGFTLSAQRTELLRRVQAATGEAVQEIVVRPCPM